MRRMVLVCFTVLLSAGLASVVTFSVSAQTASEEQYSGGEAPSEAPPPSGPLPGGDEGPEDTGPQQPAAGSPQARAAASEGAGAETPAGGASAERSPDREVQPLPHSRPSGQKGGPAFTGTIPEDPYHQVAADATGAADAFRFEIPTTRHYSVWAWWEPSEDNASAALFEVPTTSGVGSDVVDQRVDSGFWVLIGVFEMREGTRTVRLEDGRGTGQATAEQVMVIGDAAVAPNGETASFADPNAIEPLPADTAGGGEESAFSTQRAIRNPSRSDVERIARKHRGTRYGNSRCIAFRQEDCSCFTKLVYRKVGVGLPDSPVGQWRQNKGTNYKQRSKLRVGHLVFHDLNRDGRLDDQYRDHVEIYVGNGKVIHASSYWGYVTVTDMRYLDGFWGGKRYRF